MGRSCDILVVAGPASSGDIARVLRTAPQQFRPLEAANEAQARQFLSQGEPMAIVFDDAAPVMARARGMALSDASGAGIPIVVIGREAAVPDALRALDEGAADYVVRDNLVRLPWTIERAVRTEHERRHHVEALQQQLAASQERFRMFAETSKDWMWEVDHQARLLYSNRAVLDCLGYEPDELIGQYMPGFLDDDSREEVEREFPRVVAAGDAFRNWRLRWRHKDRYWKTLESTGVALFDDAGVVTGFRGVSPDFTEQLRNVEKIERLSRIHAVLSAVSNVALRAASRTELLRGACDAIVRVAGFEAALIAEVEAGSTFRIVARAGNPALLDAVASDPVVDLCPQGPFERHPATIAINERREVAVVDFADVEPSTPLSADMLRNGIRSQVSLPVGDGPWGLLGLYSDATLRYEADEIVLLRRLADEIDYGSRLLAKNEQLHHLAFHHHATGLPNRSAFLAYLDDKAPDACMAVAAVEVARMGDIASARGRAFADALLGSVGAALRVPDGFVAHVEGSSFLVGWPCAGNLRDEVARLEALLAHREERGVLVDGQLVHALFNAGIASGDAGDAESLERNANAALAHATRRGQRIAAFNTELRTRLAQALDLERDLRKALEREEFELHYQPKVDAATRRLVGAEALLRWRHPLRGLVPPAEFIPTLEETGLIVPVGGWVMAQALATALHWRRTAWPGLRIAINVSARELRHRHFLREATQLLEPFSDNQPLDIEVTESVLMEDIEQSIATLQQLRQLGCRVEIDDFGTGYSSLNYLVKLPIDAVKIDRSFVAALADSPQTVALSNTIISLAHSLGLSVVAEGVETDEQARLLHLLRCDTLQGFLLGRPLDAGAFAGRVLAKMPASSG